jgi:transaldolase
MTNTLHQLLDQGQSPWIDNITRDMLENGELQRLIDQGIVGLTSNPTIFQKAIAGSKLYEDQLRQLVRADKSVSEIFDGLILEDIRDAANTLRPVYDRSEGRDGFVSIEVLPSLAFDCDKTLTEARRLFNYLSLPNVFIKIPATEAGLPAIRQSIAEGININITLIFAIEIYRQVANAFIEGLEERVKNGQPVDRVASVASFFVSRVDTAVDKQLDELIAQTDDEGRKQELRNLQGKAAIANAKLAYAAFQEIFSGPRWEALAAKGAKPQRCLWASTSTKNPNYRDVLYVEQLIGPHTVDTMPPATIQAFLDHGVVERTLDRDVDRARAELAALEDAGVSMDQVTAQLQQDGVKLFANSFNELIDTISKKREEMMAAAG